MRSLGTTAGNYHAVWHQGGLVAEHADWQIVLYLLFWELLSARDHNAGLCSPILALPLVLLLSLF